MLPIRAWLPKVPQRFCEDSQLRGNPPKRVRILPGLTLRCPLSIPVLWFVPPALILPLTPDCSRNFCHEPAYSVYANNLGRLSLLFPSVYCEIGKSKGHFFRSVPWQVWPLGQSEFWMQILSHKSSDNQDDLNITLSSQVTMIFIPSGH